MKQVPTPPFLPDSASGSGNDIRLHLRKTLLDYPRVALINTLVAIVLTYALEFNGSLFENWVFSMCVGSIAYLMINGGQYLIWRGRRPPTALFYLWSFSCAPLAFFAGVKLGAVLLNIPIQTGQIFRFTITNTSWIITAIVSTAASWYFWNRSKMTELLVAAETEKARSAAIERQAMQAQLQLLQAQIEPHMLFNTLANLQGLIALDQQKAQHMLAQLIVYLRATLSSSRAGQTTLKQEFTLMQAYLELLAIRMGKRLCFSLDLPDELQSQPIAPMLLQPLVENAIKHGIEPNVKGGHILVRASKDEHFLHVCVADDGLGLPYDFEDQAVAPSAEGHHVGNANIRDRLLAVYGPAARLSLTPNQPQGAVAHLYIPLHN